MHQCCLLRNAKRQLQDWLQDIPRIYAAHSRDSEQSLHVILSGHARDPRHSRRSRVSRVSTTRVRVIRVIILRPS
jgi:hypothetical protein